MGDTGEIQGATSGWVVARSSATAPPSEAPTSTTGLPYRVRVRVRVRVGVRDRDRVGVIVRVRGAHQHHRPAI